MKRCPQCRRDYTDETLNFCLDDGTLLVEGPATAESPTEILSTLPSEAATKHQLSETGNFPAEGSLSSKEFVLSTIRTNKFGAVVFGLIILVVVGGFGYGLYSLVRGGDKGGAADRTEHPDLKIQPIISSGNVREAAISPDGKFLAYTENANGKAALWTKQISTNSNIQIAPPTEFDYFALRFSPDGDYVYYGINESAVGSLYRVPTLGGRPPVKIVSDVDGQPTFSPDGKQFAFERYSFNNSESTLIIVNSDGSEEKKLASLNGHRYFSSTSLAWSPDGKMIACSVGDDTQEKAHVMAWVDVTSGELHEFGKQRFDGLGHAVWLGDQSALYFIASISGSNVDRGIWEISYPSGEARQVTHDLKGYAYLSITADSKTLVAVQRETFASVDFSATNDITKAKPITRGKDEGPWGMTLTPDGRIVYVSNISGATEIWTMNNDGSGARQLTNDGFSKYTPLVTGDGRYIAFISEKGGDHLWRMNLDGTQLVQLTSGSNDENPRPSPDGKWIVYDSFRSGKQVLWRVPVEGGEPQQLTEFFAMEPDVSPDGKYIACFIISDQSDKKIRIAVIPFDGGPLIKTFDVPQTVAVDNSPQWMPDGKGITYIDWTSDVSNLWLQPVDGGAPRQLTKNTQGYIFRREWTRDGKQVASVVGSETSDAVMITNFR